MVGRHKWQKGNGTFLSSSGDVSAKAGGPALRHSRQSLAASEEALNEGDGTGGRRVRLCHNRATGSPQRVVERCEGWKVAGVSC